MLEARTAVMLALRQGPAFGRELPRRIRSSSGGRVRRAEGSIYPALRRLENAGIVRSWIVVPGRRRGGRGRRYYELSERGIRAAEAAARGLLALLGGPTAGRPVSARQIERMRERLALASELSEAALELRVRPSPGGSAA